MKSVFRAIPESLFNTDGQIFSDVGVPVCSLWKTMISAGPATRHEDNMSNIDLDYGSAVAAIAIESVARVAHASRPGR